MSLCVCVLWQLNELMLVDDSLQAASMVIVISSLYGKVNSRWSWSESAALDMVLAQNQFVFLFSFEYIWLVGCIVRQLAISGAHARKTLSVDCTTVLLLRNPLSALFLFTSTVSLLLFQFAFPTLLLPLCLSICFSFLCALVCHWSD